MAYKVIDRETYYRREVFRRFSEDCKCSLSLTARIDVTDLAAWSKATGTKFYLNFLYLLSKVLNSREDYRMDYLYRTGELIVYDAIHPTHYAFHADTETCTPVYSTYYPDYKTFYRHAEADLSWAKENPVYIREATKEPNRFDASYIPWVSYDAMHLELPDGYLYFAPIVNWGAYRAEGGRLRMPVTVRMNHAVADGYLVALAFRLLEQEMDALIHDHSEE